MSDHPDFPRFCSDNPWAGWKTGDECELAWAWEIAAGHQREFQRGERVDAQPDAPAAEPLPEHDSWAPVDLGPYLRGEVTRPTPTVGLARSDGLRLLYPGKEHAVIGEMESGKSWFSLACAAAEMSDGHPVVYLHFEEIDPSDTVERLQALGMSADVMIKLLRFVGPQRPVSVDALARLLDPAPSLVIFDGVNEAMSLHRWGIRDEDGAALFRRHLVKPCTAVGAATLSADHVVKDREGRGRYAIGSVHKGNGLSGALITLDTAEPFGRGLRGRAHVHVVKDRPGHLRRSGTPTSTPGKTHMGELIIDDTRTAVSYLDVAFYAPRADQAAEQTAPDTAGLAEQVRQVLSALPGQVVASERELLAEMRRAGHEARDSTVRRALDDLLAAGSLAVVFGPRNAKGYRVVSAADDQSE